MGKQAGAKTQGSTPVLQGISRARFSWERGSEVGTFAPSFGVSAAFNELSRCSLQTPAMWWALLLLLPFTIAPRPSRAGPLQNTLVFRLTQQGPWGSGAGNSTVSPCEWLPVAGVTTLTFVNRGLERLPGCLPRALRSLDGSHNLLRALSAPELGHLPQLQVLKLRHNRIAALRWGPGAPAGLHSLDLSYNLLATLPPCTGPALPGLRALALAGNPLRALQPGAFACFPELRLLNLSYTELGRGDHEDIADATFAGVGGAPLAALRVLDLSGTFLPRGECRRRVSKPAGWTIPGGRAVNFLEGRCPPGVFLQEGSKRPQRFPEPRAPCSKRLTGLHSLSPKSWGYHLCSACEETRAQKGECWPADSQLLSGASTSELWRSGSGAHRFNLCSAPQQNGEWGVDAVLWG